MIYEVRERTWFFSKIGFGKMGYFFSIRIKPVHLSVKWDSTTFRRYRRTKTTRVYTLDISSILINNYFLN